MWPLDKPARDVLKLPGQTAIPWAVFDAAWYRLQYPELVAFIEEGNDRAVLELYLEDGQALGHAPNVFFDETWHRLAYPGVSAAVQGGVFASAFDAYCRGGNKDRSAHWLFDERYYRTRYPDLTDEALQAGGLANGYDHFLRHGCKEGRVGHPMFMGSVYLDQFDQADADGIGKGNPFAHYLGRLDRRAKEVRTTIYFDPDWYRGRYPLVQAAIDSGGWRSALEHYLCNETPVAFDPLPVFSEAHYLERYPELAGAIGRSGFRNGYNHFLRFGARELRSPHETFDLTWYGEQERVRNDIEQRKAPDAFTHWLTIGRPEGLLRSAPIEQTITVVQARALSRTRAAALVPMFGRSPLDFSCNGEPDVSVVVVPSADLTVTLNSLASLRGNFPGAIELILVDAGGQEALRYLGRYLVGATIVRFELDGGPLRSRNAALPFARAESVLFLGAEVTLSFGALDGALRRIAADPRIAALGGMVLRPDGTIQEAGGIVWRDGSLGRYLQDDSPLAPEANFLRDVDFCSASFLLVRRSALEALEGFDDAFDSPWCADADACLRLRGLGHKVLYDPRIQIIDTAMAAESAASIGQGRLRLRDRHADYLAERPEPDGRAVNYARSSGRDGLGSSVGRILFIEDMIPLRLYGSGFVRSNDLIATMAGLGYAVTVYPMIGNRAELAGVYADMPASVEVMHDRMLDDLTDFLRLRLTYYDTIWIARTHNLDRVRSTIESMWPDKASRPRIVLDTEAIASLRLASQARLTGENTESEAAMRQEFANADCCDHIVAVSQAEADRLRGIGLTRVSVVGHMRQVRATPRAFENRRGLLFVGAMHKSDSPNYESLAWFAEAVLPLIDRTLGWETRLTIAGYIGADVNTDRLRANPRITLLGAVGDTTALYDRHRIFVAPTRVAAGVPYKVHEAASVGLPVVTTSLLRDQLGWTDGVEILSVDGDDAAGMAAAIIRLYRDAALWQSLRDAALDRMATDHRGEDYAVAVSTIINTANTKNNP